MANRSTVYTPATYNVTLFYAGPGLRGLALNPTTNDVTTEIVQHNVIGIGGYVWEALGYLDVLDTDQ